MESQLKPPPSGMPVTDHLGVAEINDLVYRFCSDVQPYIPASIFPYCEHHELLIDRISDFIDVNYVTWLIWLFTPIIISFLLPAVILIFVYGCAIFLRMYKRRNRLIEAYNTNYWACARTAIASFWDAQASIWHGYEVCGFENVPSTGPALIIYFHGTLPLDMYYVIAKCILDKNRTLSCVADRFVLQVPGWRTLCEVFCVTTGSVDSCVEMLKAGHLLSISPGGVREALFASECYKLTWGDRLGFARIAVQSGVPVIPMFTENCREAFRPFPFGTGFFRWLYEKTRLPLMPIYGGFPVKLRTHFGEPLTFSPGTSPEVAREKIMDGILKLIKQNQRVPGSIVQAMLDRLRTPRGPFISNGDVSHADEDDESSSSSLSTENESRG